MERSAARRCPTLGRIWKDPVAAALDDRRLGRVLAAVVGGGGGAGGGLGGGVLGGGLGGAVAALAAVVLGLTLLLQGEPARDVVQLGRVGQVDQDLQGEEEEEEEGQRGFKGDALGDLTPDWSLVESWPWLTSPRKSLEEPLS